MIETASRIVHECKPPDRLKEINSMINLAYASLMLNSINLFNLPANIDGYPVASNEPYESEVPDVDIEALSSMDIKDTGVIGEDDMDEIDEELDKFMRGDDDDLSDADDEINNDEMNDQDDLFASDEDDDATTGKAKKILKHAKD